MPAGQPKPRALSVDPNGQRPGMLRLMQQRRVVCSALKLSLVVGTILNLINNGEYIWTHHTVNLWQATLNFVVPYCVSSYSAARDEVQRARGDR